MYDMILYDNNYDDSDVIYYIIADILNLYYMICDTDKVTWCDDIAWYDV